MRAALQILATSTLVAIILAVATLLQGEAPVVVDAGLVIELPPVQPEGPLRWIVFGGGATPADSQVTIEADVIDAAKTLGGDGAVLFSGGSDAACVQVLDKRQQRDPLIAELSGFFSPRHGRASSYRRPNIAATAATAGALLHLLDQQLDARSAGDLLLYAAGHGEMGDDARDNYIALWQGSRLTAADLAAALDRAPPGRVVRMVATTCFSGGFAEIAFEGGDHRIGAARTARCGLFAATWDLESTGCDPDPDRHRHHGFGAYFLPALRARDRDGAPLASEVIDFDGDGAVSLLEAHARVRIAAPTADVPTTTSERWLRAVAPLSGPASPTDALPEDDAVIGALAQRLEVRKPELHAKKRYEAIDALVKAAERQVKTLHEQEDSAWFAVQAALLARWPVLDDPWHPGWSPMMRSQRHAIADFTKRSTQWRTWKAAVASSNKAADRRDALRLQRAQHERLLRAVENRQLAGRLASKRGEDWLYWRQLLRCERFVPKLR